MIIWLSDWWCNCTVILRIFWNYLESYGLGESTQFLLSSPLRCFHIWSSTAWILKLSSLCSYYVSTKNQVWGIFGICYLILENNHQLWVYIAGWVSAFAYRLCDLWTYFFGWIFRHCGAAFFSRSSKELTVSSLEFVHWEDRFNHQHWWDP